MSDNEIRFALCGNCPELVTFNVLPGDRSVKGWFHAASGSELCGSVNDEQDERTARPRPCSD